METSIKLEQVKVSQIGEMIKLLSLNYDKVESLSFNKIAGLITKEFKVECTHTDIEKYYEIDLNEDFEKESRIVEYNINNYDENS